MINLDLKNFFNNRPSLSKRGIEREADLPDSKIKEVLKGNQKLSVAQIEKLLPVLKKYGWKSMD